MMAREFSWNWQDVCLRSPMLLFVLPTSMIVFITVIPITYIIMILKMIIPSFYLYQTWSFCMVTTIILILLTINHDHDLYGDHHHHHPFNYQSWSFSMVTTIIITLLTINHDHDLYGDHHHHHPFNYQSWSWSLRWRPS